MATSLYYPLRQDLKKPLLLLGDFINYDVNYSTVSSNQQKIDKVFEGSLKINKVIKKLSEINKLIKESSRNL